MTSHSCDPNMEILRVFQGGVLPADLQVILVAMKTFRADDELTLNYGDDYVKKWKIRETTRVLRHQVKKQCV